jgi:hypothetical protein
VTQCLDVSSEAKVRAVCEKELLSVHLNSIVCQLDSVRNPVCVCMQWCVIVYAHVQGLVSMLKNEKLDEARRMYTLLARIAPGTSVLVMQRSDTSVCARVCVCRRTRAHATGDEHAPKTSRHRGRQRSCTCEV